MGAVVSGLRVEVSNTLWKGTQHCGFLPRRTCQDSKPQTTYISRQTQKGNSLIPSKADKNKQRPYIMEYKKWIDFISNKKQNTFHIVVHLFCLHLPPCHPSYLLTAPSKPHSKVTVHSDVTLCSRRISCQLRCRGKAMEAERLLQIEDWHLLYPFVASWRKLVTSDLWYIVISICSHVVDDLRSFREIVLTCIDVYVI